MVMDPTNPEVVYASAPASMYKTVDGGASWSPIGGSGVSLIIDPSNPNTLYAGLSPSGGVVKSVDGGETFLPASNGLGTPAVFTLAIDPNNPNVLYAGTEGLGAFKSIDGAQTWTPVDIDSTVWSLLIDPTDSNIVYAGTNGHGIYRSVDAGNSFVRIGSPEVGVVFALAKSGRHLFAGTATQGISVSEDGGRRWRNAGVTPNTVLIMSVGVRGEVYAGTNFDGVFVHRAERFEDRDHYRAHEREWHRLAWQQLQRCACQNGHAIAVDPGDHEHVFLSTNDGGLLVTEDGGRHWSDGGVNGLISRAPYRFRSASAEPRVCGRLCRQPGRIQVRRSRQALAAQSLRFEFHLYHRNCGGSLGSFGLRGDHSRRPRRVEKHGFRHHLRAHRSRTGCRGR
jgi:photosystem II stability/assembly factor-like uncharacterized protein